MLNLRSGSLSVTFDTNGGVTAVHHLATDDLLTAADAPAVPVWELGLMQPVTYDDPLPPLRIPEREYEGHEWWANRNEYSAEIVVDSSAAEPRVEATEAAVTFTWQVPVDGGSATVVLRWQVAGDAIEVRAEVELPEHLALRYLMAPRMRGFGNLDDPDADAALMPRNFGVMRRNPLEAMTDYRGQYPSGSQWGQFVGWLHGDAALYLGMPDPDCNHTGLAMQYVEGAATAPCYTERWDLERDDATWQQEERRPLAERLDRQPSMELAAHHWPGMLQQWQSPYPVVLQGLSGGWHAIATHHREWALKQRWCRRGLVREQPPKAFADLDLWVTRYGFHPASREPTPAWDFRDAMLELRDYFGCPFGVHWYHWHAFSWHSTYPRHAPVVEGFEEVLSELQANDILVMPYCQGRLLYRDRPAFDTERSHAIIEANGQPYLEQYTGGDDWPLALCSHSEWSRRQWHEAARLLWRHYGVEGVYYDQIAAMPPSLCYHAGHAHAPGGGNTTWRGYDEALACLDEMLAEDPRRFVASESLCDAYIDRLDLFLAFVPPLEDYVPLWPAVYSGYTTTMGRATPAPLFADQQLFVMCQGEQLLFGGQLGWLDEQILKHPRAAAFLRDAVRLRAKLRPWLADGTLLPELALRIEGASIERQLPTAFVATSEPVIVRRPPVRQTHWEAADGSRLILLLNESTTAAEVAGLPTGGHLRRLGAADAEEAATGRVELPAFGAVAIRYDG